MVQGYTQEGCGSTSGWYSPVNGNFISAGFEGFSTYSNRLAYEQWFVHPSEEFKLSISSHVDREVGGSMLNVTGLNHFYYIRKLTTQRNSMLHFGSDEGMEMAATYHSVISTVKLHGKSVWNYLGKRPKMTY